MYWVKGSGWPSVSTKTTTVSSTHSKLVCIPGLVVGCIDDGVESWDHTTGRFYIIRTAAIPTGVTLEVLSGLRSLVGLVHLTVWPCPRQVWVRRGEYDSGCSGGSGSGSVSDS